VLSVQLLALSISALIAWAHLYSDTPFDYVHAIGSLAAADPSWVPPGFKQTPVIGRHYFGDLQLLLAWAAEANPWLLDPFTANYWPTGYYLLKPLTFLPTQLTFIIYLIATLGVLAKAFTEIMTGNTELAWSDKLNFILLFGLLTSPTITDIDRGNLQTISISSVVIYLTLGLRNHPLSGLPWLFLASSFKPYMLIFAVCFLNRAQWKKIIAAVLLFLIFNILLLGLINGSILLGCERWLTAFLAYSGSAGADHMMTSGSATGAILRWGSLFLGKAESLQFLLEHLYLFKALSVATLALGLAIWFQYRRPAWVRLFGALSIISIAQPGSHNYHWVWPGFIIVAFLCSEAEILSKQGYWSLRYLQTVCLLSLVPTWLILDFRNIDMQLPNYLLLAPLVIIGQFLLLWNGLRSRREFPPQENTFGLINSPS
jgi:hypothetical protein